MEYKSKLSDPIIDLRSDTVTRPSKEMREAIAKAKVGDDVLGDDPTVNALQEKAAKLLSKEAALFVSSGTQSNLCSILSHCSRGEELITGDDYHVFNNEAGGASVLGSIVMTALKTLPNGNIEPADIEKSIKPDDAHYPISKLVSLENTVKGRVQTIEHINKCVNVAQKFGLSTHMDGARLMNAAVKLNSPVSRIVENVDSVSLCLSKGLGAPAGSVLAGSKQFISRAYRIRKLLGGALRQSGVLASAGIFALENNVERLEEDHENALYLAEKLTSITKIYVNVEDVQTNMVFCTVPNGSSLKLETFLSDRGILIDGYTDTIRLVTHLDIDSKKIDTFIDGVSSFFN